MVTKKPPVDPPDTDSYGEESSYGTHSEAIGHNSAKSSECFDANSEEIEYVERPLAPEPKVHPVQVTVMKNGNGSRFLANLLINLQKMDTFAKILLQPEAPSHYAPLQRTKDIPNDESARTFVSAYIADIRVTPQGDMKGKVWIQSQAKFPNIKKDTRFSEWLNGSTTSPTSPRIELKLSVLTGTRIFATGIFLNKVTRFDLVQNFQDQIWNALATTVDDSGPIPEFQIEIFHAHGKTGRTRLYRMATSCIEYADILNTKMTQIMPSPSADIIYIKYKVWDLLPNSKKAAYYDMQKSFADNHGALILRGISNPQALVGKLNAAGTESTANGKSMTVYEWLTVLQAADKYTLFPKVLPCENGEIELWHHISHAQEARAWATTALAEIARLARIAHDPNAKERASELFTNPAKVQQCIEQMKHEISLPQARSAFLNYLPPVRSGDATQVRQGQRNKKPRAGPLKLIFDLDAVTDTNPSTTNNAPAIAWKSRQTSSKPPNLAGGAQPSSGTTEQATSEEAIAKREAAKAIAVAEVLTKRYPSHGHTAHQGMYETIADKYGNLVPVVALNGKWVVLTEKTLIASRKNAKPRNFGISRAATKIRKTTKPASATIACKEKPAERKRWGDEDSSEDEWAKAQNESFQYMDITVDTAEFEAYAMAAENEKWKHTVSGKEDQCEATTPEDTSYDVVMEEAVTVTRVEMAHQDVESAEAPTGGTFAATAAKRLFATDTAESQAGNQASAKPPANDISTLTRLQSSNTRSVHPVEVLQNAEPPGKKVGQKLRRSSQAVSAPARDSTDWQTVKDRNSKSRQQQRAKETLKPPPATVAPTVEQPVPRVIDERSSADIQRLEEKNSTLEQRNDELAAMMAATNLLLQDLSLKNAALTAAMAEFTSKSEAAEVAAAAAAISDRYSTPVNTGNAMTPVKKRASKKSSLELTVERTPPKPPEGTPQRNKKKKVSKSPASNPNTNRFSPLRGAATDDEDSSAEANETNELAPVNVPGESAVDDDHKATATTPTPKPELPGFGSNGVGSAE